MAKCEKEYIVDDRLVSTSAVYFDINSSARKHKLDSVTTDWLLYGTIFSMTVATYEEKDRNKIRLAMEKLIQKYGN